MRWFAVLSAALPIPLDLGGFSATIDGRPTHPFFVNRNQANLQLPFGLTAGRKIFVITVNGVRSVPYFLEIADSGPGVFTYDDGRRAVAQNVSNTQNYTLNSAQDPIGPGGVLIVYITGQGELDAAIPTGAVAPSSPLSRPRLPVRATIGGRAVRGTFVMTPGLAGVLQGNLEIDGLAAGEQELIVYIGEVPSKPTYVYIGN
ncbi:MAG: hypothetical protein ACRD44_08390 [Bryobacteraceae bacterium]